MVCAIEKDGRNGGSYEEKKHDGSSVDGKYGTGSLREKDRDECGGRPGETTEEASNEAATGETEQSTKGVDVGDYLENFGELKNILQMTTTECWQFPNAQSYVSDGFYLEWQGETFSMKNEGNQAVALYGIHIGDEAGASGKAMTDHGWTEYQYGGYIMQTDKAQYYMELESDENGKVTSWYLNNWPEGDITEAYDSLEKQ